MFGSKKQSSYTIKIEGMSCMHCAGSVKKSLEAAGATSVKVDLTSGTADVKAGEGVTKDQLKAAVEDAGYKVLNINKKD